MALGKGAGSAHLLALHPRRQLLLPALALLACLLGGQRGIDGGQGAVGLGARHGVLVGGAVGRAHWSGRECAMVAQDAMVASPVGRVVAVLGADAGQKGCPLGGRLAGGLCGSARASDAEAGDSLVVVVGAGRAGRERRTVVATGVGIVEGFVRGGGVALSQTARLGGRVVVRCRRRERRSGRHGFGGERSIGQETGVFTEALGGERWAVSRRRSASRQDGRQRAPSVGCEAAGRCLFWFPSHPVDESGRVEARQSRRRLERRRNKAGIAKLTMQMQMSGWRIRQEKMTEGPRQARIDFPTSPGALGHQSTIHHD